MPKKKDVSNEVLKNCYSHNTDGCGYAFIDNENKLIIRKYLDFKKFKKAFRRDQIETKSNTPFLIHFRDTSMGLTNLKSCHPFSVNDDQAMAHNGTIYSVPKEKNKSDTMVFNETVLKNLPIGWDKNKTICMLVTEFIGKTKLLKYNKIVILNSDRSYTILNEGDGEWVDNIWYSNNDYKEEYIPYNYSTTVVFENVSGIKRSYISTKYGKKYRVIEYKDGGLKQELIEETHEHNALCELCRVYSHNCTYSKEYGWVCGECRSDMERCEECGKFCSGRYLYKNKLICKDCLNPKKDAITCDICGQDLLENEISPIYWEDEVLHVCVSCESFILEYEDKTK